MSFEKPKLNTPQEVLDKPEYKFIKALIIGIIGGLGWQYTLNYWLTLFAGHAIQVVPDDTLFPAMFFILLGYFTWMVSLPLALITFILSLIIGLF